MFLSQDYRSRAIGAIAAIGVLITGVAVERTTAQAPAPQAVQAAQSVGKAQVSVASRLASKCETGTVPVC